MRPFQNVAADVRRLISNAEGRMKKDEVISGAFHFKPMFLHSAFFLHPSV
jgi:hypothetical protein